MSAYRETIRGEAPPSADAAVRDAVGHVVQQFADAMAFWRELVQNSIDAGATEVHALLTWEAPDAAGGAGELRASLIDDGSGMTREIIERALLVLFRSTKEGDKSKIGKFGVGFFSVFAVGPEAVIVDTGTGADGHRVVLDPTFGYELEEIAPRRGTTVTLRLRRTEADARAFAHESFAALGRWCEHVAIPVHARCAGLPGAPAERRVDRPFGFDDPIHVIESDGERVYGVALGAIGSTSFYNRGMLIHRELTGANPGIVAKISDPELSHTIARDDVRRDAAHARGVKRIARLIEGALVERALAVAAEACARWPDDRAAASALMIVCHTVQFDPRLRAAIGDRLELPLAAPAKRKASATVRDLARDRPWLHGGSGVLAQAVAATGRRVVAAPGAYGPHLSMLEALIGSGRSIDSAYGAVEMLPEETLEDGGLALLATLRPLLASIRISGAVFARLHGAGSERFFVALDGGRIGAKEPLLLESSDVERGPYARFVVFGKRAVAIRADHPRTIAAMRLARQDPRTAAWAIARCLLLEADVLDETSDRLLLASYVEETGAAVVAGEARS